LIEGLEHPDSDTQLVWSCTTHEREDGYAFKKPNVLNMPQEQPTTESQPASPSSGGAVSVFAATAGASSSAEVLSRISEGMIREVWNEIKEEEY
jgi:hypothetical protein